LREKYVTLAAEKRCEIEKVKGSRFLATAIPVAGADAAAAFVARVRAELRDATHNCWAWRLDADGRTYRFSDDGEPGGSAGRPILQQIEGRELAFTAVVVTRYFGGTKLGVGGLVRAYGKAAAAVLDAAPRRTVEVTVRVLLELPYECNGALQALLAARGFAVAGAEYGAHVRLALDVPVGRVDEFRREARDRTAGRVRFL
jgi:uncharacterized YigZ family protein